jgi:ABC-type lipoprotein release transport system permease subunit
MNGLLLFGGLFVVAYATLILIAFRRPLLARVAIREAIRRPLQSALVIAGLMVASGAVFTGQVLSDSTYDSLTSAAAKSWGRVDLIGSAAGQFFSADVPRQMAQDPRLLAAAGVQGGIELVGGVTDLDRRSSSGSVALIGFDPSTQPAFGSYTLEDGRQTSGADLSQHGVLLSASLADGLRAKVGDVLKMSLGEGSGEVSTQATVAGVVRPQGPGAYGLRPSVYAPLTALQSVTGSGLINVVRITGRGVGTDEAQSAHRLVTAVRDALGATQVSSATLFVREAKANDVNVEATAATNQAGFYRVLPLFVLAAGIALAINLAFALAVERRPRLAILRALGLSRAGMITVAVLEGALYSLAAAVVGIVPGLAAAWSIIGTNLHLPGSTHYGQTFQVGVSVRPASLILAIAIGALVPLGTILVTSLMSSGMSISAAIRDLPEPITAPAGRLGRVVILVVLAAISLVAIVGDAGSRLFGGVGLIVAAVLLMRPSISVRARATAAGAAVTLWALVSIATAQSLTNNQSGAPLTIGSLVIADFGLSILVAANLRLLEAVPEVLGFASGIRAILRPPLAYTTRRPIRAGLAIGTFGLVLTVLTVYAFLLGSLLVQGTASDAAAPQAGSGYSIVVTSAGRSTITLPPPVEVQVLQQEAIVTRSYLGPIRSSSPTSGNPAFALDWHQELLPLYTFSAEQLQNPPVQLTGRDPRFPDDAAVWRALRNDPTWVVSNRFGETTDITLIGPSGPVQRRVAASYAAGLLVGIAGSSEALAPFASAPQGSTLLLKIRPGADVGALASEIHAAALPAAVDASPVSQLLDRGGDTLRAFVSIPELFARLGLIVGVLSLGILAFRAVVERRHAIGVLRALGYRRKDLVAGMLAEAGVLVTTGVVVGVGVGVIGAVLYLRIANPGTAFALDVGDLGTALLAVYIAVFLATIGPALRASRLPPAQALRLQE